MISAPQALALNALLLLVPGQVGDLQLVHHGSKAGLLHRERCSLRVEHILQQGPWAKQDGERESSPSADTECGEHRVCKDLLNKEPGTHASSKRFRIQGNPAGLDVHSPSVEARPPRCLTNKPRTGRPSTGPCRVCLWSGITACRSSVQLGFASRTHVFMQVVFLFLSRQVEIPK